MSRWVRRNPTQVSDVLLVLGLFYFGSKIASDADKAGNICVKTGDIPLIGKFLGDTGPGCKPAQPAPGANGNAWPAGSYDEGNGYVFVPGIGSVRTDPGYYTLPAGTALTHCDCDAVKAMLTGCTPDPGCNF